MLHLAGRRHGYMGYIGWIGAEAEAIPVTFVDQTGAKRLQARVSPDMPVKKILPSVISAMRLPAIAPDGTPMSYALDHKEGGIRLIEDESLAHAGVRPGDHLIVYPEIVAGMLGGLGVDVRSDVIDLLDRARSLVDRGREDEALRLAEEARAIAHDSGNYGLVRRSENMILAIEERARGTKDPWYIMGLGYQEGMEDVGLHTEAEQDYAERLAEERYGLAWESVEVGQKDSFHYNLGYLKALKDIASHEGADALVAGVSGMIRELERVGKSRIGW